MNWINSFLIPPPKLAVVMVLDAKHKAHRAAITAVARGCSRPCLEVFEAVLKGLGIFDYAAAN